VSDGDEATGGPSEVSRGDEAAAPDEGVGSSDSSGPPDSVGPLPTDGAGQSREEWHEGPDEDAPPESWIGLDDDELLHRIETEGGDAPDDLLMEVVESERHFFIRQEAAKRVRDRAPLFDFEDDRHVGQILVRHLTRREDVTYLERLVARSTHVEVRAAAQVQLARLGGRVGGATGDSPGGGPTLPPPEFYEAPQEVAGPGAGPGADASSPRFAPADTARPTRVSGDTVRPSSVSGDTVRPSSVSGDTLRPSSVSGDAVRPSSSSGNEDVDATLLGWALHFVIQEAWSHLGTTATRGILRRTHAELLPANESLEVFRVEEDAHVTVDLRRGARVPRESVDAVARSLVAFIESGSRSSDEVAAMDVRAATRLMGDALDHVRFYEAIAAAWTARRR